MKKRGGARPKDAQKLTAVLYVRVSRQMFTDLDRLTEQYSQADPLRSRPSRADVVRMCLRHALATRIDGRP